MAAPPARPSAQVPASVLHAAQVIAASQGHHEVDTEHVALGLLTHDLAPFGIDATAWLARIHVVWDLQRASGHRAEPLPVLAGDQVGVSRRVRAVLALAADEAVANAHEDVQVRHLVVALLREGGGMAAGTMHDMGLRVGHLRRAAGLLSRPRVVAGGLAPPDNSEPPPSGPLVLMGGGPGTPTAQARFVAWTAARLGRAPRIVQAFVTMDDDRGDDAHLASVADDWLQAGAGSADDAGVYDRADAFRPEVCERLQAADVVFLPGGFPERAYDVLWGTPALEAIRTASARGAVVAGSSAGARIWGIGTLSDFASDGDDAVFPLVGWLPAVVFNHYSPGREVELRQHLEHWPGASALAISNGAAVLVQPGCSNVSLLTASVTGEGAFVLRSPRGELLSLTQQQPVALRG